MKEKIMSMTLEEMKKKYKMTPAQRKEMLANAPEFSIDEIPELAGFVPTKTFRGFAAFKEHINRSGRPKIDDPKQVVSIRLPASMIKTLRATGKGWQTRLSEYAVAGIRAGVL